MGKDAKKGRQNPRASPPLAGQNQAFIRLEKRHLEDQKEIEDLRRKFEASEARASAFKCIAASQGKLNSDEQQFSPGMNDLESQFDLMDELEPDHADEPDTLVEHGPMNIQPPLVLVEDTTKNDKFSEATTQNQTEPWEDLDEEAKRWWNYAWDPNTKVQRKHVMCTVLTQESKVNNPDSEIKIMAGDEICLSINPNHILQDTKGGVRDFGDAVEATKRILCRFARHPQSDHSFWGVRSLKKGIPAECVDTATFIVAKQQGARRVKRNPDTGEMEEETLESCRAELRHRISQLCYEARRCLEGGNRRPRKREVEDNGDEDAPPRRRRRQITPTSPSSLPPTSLPATAHKGPRTRAQGMAIDENEIQEQQPRAPRRFGQ